MHIPACGRQAKYIGYTPELEGYANLFVYTPLYGIQQHRKNSKA